MKPDISLFAAPEPIRWDQHCLLVINFPSSLRADFRRSRRFAEVKRGLWENFERFSPHRALDFFLHPATIPFFLGFGPSARSSGPQATSRSARPGLSV